MIIKYLLFFTFISFSLSTTAKYYKAAKAYKINNDKAVFSELMDSHYYFSAIPFAGRMVAKNKVIDSETEMLLEKLILKTGTTALTGLPEELLYKTKSPSLSLVSGLKFFNKKKYKKAYMSLKKIENGHRFSPEARMIQGSSLNLINKHSKAIEKYKTCYTQSEQFEGRAKNEKLKRYYALIKESCLIHQARILYKRKDYKKAVEKYELISKNSYKWPYLLIEKAWAHYYLEDFNRSLGLLVTYKSPLLNSYFLPEAEVLNSLNYYNMCLWDDSLAVIQRYYNVYRPKSDQLKKILLENKKSSTYFLKLMFSSMKKNDQMNPYIRNLVTQIRKKVKFSVNLNEYKKAKRELKNLKKLYKRKPTPFTKNLVKEVSYQVKWRTQHLNHFIKKNMFRFVNDIHRFSYELFNVKLDILSKKRNLVYKNKELANTRSRGDISNVRRSPSQHFWTFNGEFWADELGDYSFGLKNNCQISNKKSK